MLRMRKIGLNENFLVLKYIYFLSFVGGKGLLVIFDSGKEYYVILRS